MIPLLSRSCSYTTYWVLVLPPRSFWHRPEQSFYLFLQKNWLCASPKLGPACPTTATESRIYSQTLSLTSVSARMEGLGTTSKESGCVAGQTLHATHTHKNSHLWICSTVAADIYILFKRQINVISVMAITFIDNHFCSGAILLAPPPSNFGKSPWVASSCKPSNDKCVSRLLFREYTVYKREIGWLH